MKKLFLFLLAMTMLLCLCACGGKEEKKTSNNEDKGVSTSSTASTEATNASRTQILYGTDANGTIITQVVAIPDTDPTATKTHAVTTAPPQSTTTTASPTFTYEDENMFNDATLAW